MTARLTLCRSPGEEFHYRALDIDSESPLIIQSKDQLIEQIAHPFEPGSSATVFHVHEVMRIALSQVKYTGIGGEEMVHSNGISSKFETLSYHAASLWKEWPAAVDEAGGAIRTILQRMFGVRIRQNGWWIPHPTEKYIEVNDDWSIIDDVIASSTLLEELSPDDIWISAETGLRLIRNGKRVEGRSETLSHFFGKNHRFPTASSWLQWSMGHGTRLILPTNQGTVFYFKGMVNPGEVPRYHAGRVKKHGPFESEWWAADAADEYVPKVLINGETWAFGILWKLDEENGYWRHSYPHFHPMNGEQVVNVGSSDNGLGLKIHAGDDEPEDDELGSIDVRRSLSTFLVTEHLRALRILMIELRHAAPLSREDSAISGLGLAGSKKPSPFSDMYFINPKSGVVIGSPIETTIRRGILEMNWYVVE